MMSHNQPYYSHYDKRTGKTKQLEVHLQEVAEAARNSVPPFLHFDVVNSEQIQRLLELQGYFHDLGKYTDYFQNYLVYDRRSNYQNHAHVSAVLFYRYMIDGFADVGIDERMKDILYFLFYVMIRKHHNKLSTDGLFHLEDLPTMQSEIAEQTKNLHAKGKILSQVYGISEQDIQRLLRNAESTLEDKKFMRSVKRIQMHHAHERWYFLMIYCFSQLVDKDKSSAADLVKRDRSMLHPQLVSEYIQVKNQNQNSEINDARERARRTVLSQIDRISDQDLHTIRICTLTAPTGIGKTLTSLQAALRLNERLCQKYGYAPKIITAIPFINIIEQTKQDYAEVLKNRGILNIHHRLSDKRLVEYGSKDREIPIEKSMLEVESWEGDVVLTTFVQLFQSLLTGNNAKLKKINKLAGSIVILDEVQSIPEKYMPLVGAIIIKMADYFGTRFILMSATQPFLLEMGQRLLEHVNRKLPTCIHETTDQPGVIQLLPDYAEYYKLETRTKLIPSFHQIYTTDTFLDFFQQTWEDRSAVVVVNTINRCVALYQSMKERLEGQATVYHLSTNLIPKERKRVISEVKSRLQSGEAVVLISTQTIEAGVDLDFAVGYRDLAPLESIIQTAGRVNRNANRKDRDGKTLACPVYVVQLEKDHQWIYQLHHLDRTKKLLQQHEEINEPDYLEMIDTYYRQMADYLSQESIELWKDGVMSLHFEKISQFQLIPDDQSVVEVFVELDEEAERLADVYQMIRSVSELDIPFISDVIGESIPIGGDQRLSPYQRKALIDLLLSRMSEYMVQIRYSRFQQTKPLPFSIRGGVESSFYWVPRNQIEDYYHLEVGYGEVEEARMW
ncbi:CRISPR-associated helicase Cas3' [Brevibacillus humidisoli]|uniref:CRISPR-associated helicase Cas3' n=1 Tax=Brevibacillus humidisoli TaxID=2895522 RepID=UPI001E44778A|nr:CRISPR-associated helicase Cas3' [Brevibacillus humidisoli]UFJ39857.1 CRISPR-associated helicase Cas3' [Brevibacillus humidisoli]